MRAQSNVFHVKCFTCNVCNSILQTGDHFGIYEGKIYCRADFQQLQYTTDRTITTPSSQFSCSVISTHLSSESINMISSSCGGGAVGLPTNCINGLNSTSSLSPVSIPPSTTFDDLNFSDYPPPLSHPDFPILESQPNNKNQRQRKRRQGETNLNGVNEQPWQLGKLL